MQNAPEFLRKGFEMNAAQYCEKEENTTLHLIEFVAHTDNHVSYYKTCLNCKTEYHKLLGLGVDLPDPRKADVLILNEYIFLVMKPADVLI